MTPGVLYRSAQRLLRALSPLAARGDDKLARGLRGRREAWRRLAFWGEGVLDPARPVAWFHAPSVGEGLQARAVMDAMRVRRPELQFVFTHFSPSAEGFAERVGADVADYLPWDVSGELRRVVKALRPDLLAFTKTEIWPVAVDEAVRGGAGVALVAGFLPESSTRRQWPARALLGSSWRRLDLVAAISEEDGRRFGELGVAGERIRVTGDPAVDAAGGRAAGVDLGAPHLAPFAERQRPTLVAGSTWPSDEAVLLPALGALREVVPDLRVILAPHEPDPATVGLLLRTLSDAGWAAATLEEVTRAQGAGGASVEEVTGAADAVVVDRVGVLADLYAVATAAYVGGGFHERGLHSVLEPAAAGVPVVFGPRQGGQPAAPGLVACGGARAVRDVQELVGVLREWFTGGEARHYTAGRARGYIDAHLGAAERTADLLLDLIDDPPNPAPP